MILPDTPNPYAPAVVDTPSSGVAFPRIGATIGIIGFVVGISPTLYMAYICISSLWTVATMEIPTTSIRPMGLAVAMIGLTIVGLALAPVSFALSWLAKRLGSEGGGVLAKTSVGFVAFPFLLGFLAFVAIVIICAIRGIVIGD